MKIVITGGHLTPALAVIEKIPKDWEVLFIGRKYALEGDNIPSLEYQTIKSMSIKFVNLNAGRLQRSFSRHTIPSLFRIPKAYLISLKILRDFKPDVILGFGGYVSVPVIIAGKMLGVPTLIHEQTLDAGASNKIASRFADKILVSWESSLKYFPKNKTILTGNPVRQDFFKPIDIPEGPEELIFIFGGSTGSHALNTLVEKIIEKLLRTYRVIHMTGSLDFEKMKALRESLENASKYLVVESFNPFSMGYVLQKASLVVSRSGINTVTELIKFQKPAILIPLPSGQKNEQLKNARFMEELGLAEVLEQDNTTSQALFDVVDKMIDNLDRYRLVKKNVLKEDAAYQILKVVKNAADKKRKEAS